MCRGRLARRGFSLVELAIVITIVAVVAGIAVPRLGRAGAGTRDAALVRDLSVLRQALDRYACEHGGRYPSVAEFAKQLTRYTDADGAWSNKREAPYVFGPYVVGVPPLPVGTGGTRVGAAGVSGVAWAYDPATGQIRANTTTEADDAGRLYGSY